MYFMPGSLRISIGSHHCQRGELGGFQSSTETSRLCCWLPAAVTSLQSCSARPAEAGVSFLTELLVPFHCSADSPPRACLLLCVEQTQVPRLKALGLPWKMSAQLCVSKGRAPGPVALPVSRTGRPGEGLLGTSMASFKGQSYCFWEGSRWSGGLALPTLR